MNGPGFIFKTLSLLRIIIMLFIRSVPNCDFVRKNHQKRTRLKRLFKLCFLLIWPYNINMGSGTTNTTLASFVVVSRECCLERVLCSKSTALDKSVIREREAQIKLQTLVNEKMAKEQLLESV
jgi:hypothetical protein